MWGREEKRRERRECEALRVVFLSVLPLSAFGEAKQRVYSRCFWEHVLRTLTFAR